MKAVNPELFPGNCSVIRTTILVGIFAICVMFNIREKTENVQINMPLCSDLLWTNFHKNNTVNKCERKECWNSLWTDSLKSGTRQLYLTILMENDNFFLVTMFPVNLGILYLNTARKQDQEPKEKKI